MSNEYIDVQRMEIDALKAELASTKAALVSESHQHALDMDLLRHNLSKIQSREAKAQAALAGKEKALARAVEALRHVLNKSWTQQESEKVAQEVLASLPASVAPDAEEQRLKDAVVEAAKVQHNALFAPPDVDLQQAATQGLIDAVEALAAFQSKAAKEKKP